MATKTRTKARTLVEALCKEPRSSGFKQWFAQLSPESQKDLLYIRDEFKKGTFLRAGKTAMDVWKICRQSYGIGVGYENFTRWLNKDAQ